MELEFEIEVSLEEAIAGNSSWATRLFANSLQLLGNDSTSVLVVVIRVATYYLSMGYQNYFGLVAFVDVVTYFGTTFLRHLSEPVQFSFIV